MGHEGGRSLLRKTQWDFYRRADSPSCIATATPASAEEAEARAAFKAMSDFLTQQATLSVSYDATLEIVTRISRRSALPAPAR